MVYYRFRAYRTLRAVWATLYKARENKQQVQNVSLEEKEKHLKLKKKHMPPIPIPIPISL